MKALLLRVGIDTASGGSRAPIFTDGSFEYIPIPEGHATIETRTYSRMVGRSGRPLSDFVKGSLRNVVPHIDPEFQTFTYGDPTKTKRAQILSLGAGDLLVFYAGLQPVGATDKPRLFVIGYFEVRSVHGFSHRDRSDIAVKYQIGANAHLKRVSPDANLVIVKGRPRSSRLLEKALPLGDQDDDVLPEISRRIGYAGSLRRAVGHWIRHPDDVSRLRSWLNLGPTDLISDSSRLFSYVVDSDTGFAPNPKTSFCTLACCKPVIRQSAEPGDWILGTLPVRYGADRVCFLMRVDEALTFDQYFNDSRFRLKKPTSDHDGDNIYRLRNGQYVEVSNRHHHTATQRAHDTRVNRVLIGSLFWYFGEKAPKLPRSLVKVVVKSGPGHKCNIPNADMREVVSWASSHFRIGVHGTPRDCVEFSVRVTARLIPKRRDC
jgi:hypothetical protein